MDTASEYRPAVYDTDTTDLLPIIYRDEYNVRLFGLKLLHLFDMDKWGNVFRFLKEDKLLTEHKVVRPCIASDKDLNFVHTSEYLSSLTWSVNVAAITEFPPIAFIPNFLIRWKVLRPLRYQTSGTILAGKLAMERGWAINIGGGFHHASTDRGGGFCVYSDITLCINFLFDRMIGVEKAMIVDLGAHQGNGYERDFMHDDRVYIMDVYNRYNYPFDDYAKKAIRQKVELPHYVSDEEYLDKVKCHLILSLEEFTPDIMIYNAGTNVLAGDRLGRLDITPNGIIQRDELVFSIAKSRGIPVVMLTSGGFEERAARIVADSIINLKNKHLIPSPMW